MSQNETTTFLVTDAKNLTLIDATRKNLPWCRGRFFNNSESLFTYKTGEFENWVKIDQVTSLSCREKMRNAPKSTKFEFIKPFPKTQKGDYFPKNIHKLCKKMYALFNFKYV